jgi:hypothetical protein
MKLIYLLHSWIGFLFADSAESLVKVTIEVKMILLYVLEIDSN